MLCGYDGRRRLLAPFRFCALPA